MVTISAAIGYHGIKAVSFCHAPKTVSCYQAHGDLREASEHFFGAHLINPVEGVK